MENRISSVAKHKVLLIILGVIFVASLIANALLGYYFDRKNNDYKALKKVLDSKSNCEVCPAPATETPTPTPTPTTKTRTPSRGSGSSSSDESTSSGSDQEQVIPPPPPPSD